MVLGTASESNARVWVGWPCISAGAGLEQSPLSVSADQLGLAVDRNGQPIEFVSGWCEGSLNLK